MRIDTSLIQIVNASRLAHFVRLIVKAMELANHAILDLLFQAVGVLAQPLGIQIKIVKSAIKWLADNVIMVFTSTPTEFAFK